MQCFSVGCLGHQQRTIGQDGSVCVCWSLISTHKMPLMLPSHCNDQKLRWWSISKNLQGGRKFSKWLLTVALKSSGSRVRLPWWILASSVTSELTMGKRVVPTSYTVLVCHSWDSHPHVGLVWGFSNLYKAPRTAAATWQTVTVYELPSTSASGVFTWWNKMYHFSKYM